MALAPAKRSQHISTLLGATCCVRLAMHLVATCCDIHIGCCWLNFKNGQIFHATFYGCCMML